MSARLPIGVATSNRQGDGKACAAHNWRAAFSAAMAWGSAVAGMADPDERARRGALAEARACAWLQRHGLRIVQRNYRVRGGEIDIIALDRDCLVFVEVRQRADMRHGGAAASVDARKRARLVLAARHYVMCAGDAEQRCRFDVIAIDGGALHWLRDAFAAD